MTNADLDYIKQRLAKTTLSWSQMVSRYGTDPAKWPQTTAWWQALNRINSLYTTTTPPPTPPPGVPLAWAPPGFPAYGGYARKLAPQTSGTLALVGDTLVTLGNPKWSSQPSGNSALDISGGGNRVIIGGAIDARPTNASDDIRALLLDGGDSAAVTHIEGVLIQSANGITIRSGQTFQIENCRIEVAADDSQGVHADIIQVWDQGAPTILIDHLTGTTNYTGLSVLLPPNPKRVECRHVNLHHLASGPMLYLGDEKATVWVGEIWLNTGWYNASYRQKLDDVVLYGQTMAQYELHGADGATFVSAMAPTGGSGSSSTPADLGRRPGDYMTFARVPNLAGLTVRFGVPPGGDFVPASTVGVSYVSAGYQTAVV